MKIVSMIALTLLAVSAHAADEETYQNPVDHKAYTAPGGWRSYQPEEGVKPSGDRVVLDHVRLLQAQSEIAARTSVEELAAFVSLAKEATSRVFASYEKPAVLLVQFACVPGKCPVELASQGAPPDELLQTYYEALTQLKPLNVTGEVKFQCEFKVQPPPAAGGQGTGSVTK